MQSTIFWRVDTLWLNGSPNEKQLYSSYKTKIRKKAPIIIASRRGKIIFFFLFATVERHSCQLFFYNVYISIHIIPPFFNSYQSLILILYNVHLILCFQFSNFKILIFILSLRVKIYVVNYRKVVNICTPRGCQPGRGFGMFNGKKVWH